MKTNLSCRLLDRLQILPGFLFTSILALLFFFISPHPAHGQSAAASPAMTDEASVQTQRQPAFDHRKLAEALRAAGLAEMDEHCLPLDRLDFDPSMDSMQFRCEGKHWQCDLVDYALHEVAAEKLTDADNGRRAQPLRMLTGGSTRTGDDTELKFVNQTEETVELFWINGSGQRHARRSGSLFSSSLPYQLRRIGNGRLDRGQW